MKHALNFNPICNAVHTNNEAASALRDMAKAVENLRDLASREEITYHQFTDRVAGLLIMNLNSFEVV